MRFKTRYGTLTVIDGRLILEDGPVRHEVKERYKVRTQEVAEEVARAMHEIGERFSECPVK